MVQEDEALIAPFRGERYAGGVRLTEVIAPPYDVIAESERAELAKRHPSNVVHVILPQGNGGRYANAAARLAEWRRSGWLAADLGPGVYVVRQRFSVAGGVWRERTGVIAAVAAEPFSTGRVKPHERTHPGPKQDRLALLRATGTMCEGLLMLTRDKGGGLRQALADVVAGMPTTQAQLDRVTISMWRVGEPRAARLAALIGRDPLYIADGHHRYETAVAYRAENPTAARTLALIVPLGDPGLVVLPTHRLVSGKPVPRDVVAGMTKRFVVEALSGLREVRGALAALRGGPGGCVVALKGEAFRLARRTGKPPAELSQAGKVVGSLDVAWADALVVPQLKEAAGAGQLNYTPDLDAALQAVDSGSAAAAVLLAPPAVEDVLAVADAGEFMPPKATFFTPKVPSGLVFLNYGRPTA